MDLTVVVPCSPVPSHPSTELVEICMRSIDRRLGLRDCPKVFACDEPHPLQRERREEPWRGWKKRLRRLIETDPAFRYGEIVENDRWLHLSGSLARALERVKTKFALVFQHDHEVVREADVGGILRALEMPGVEHVRINRYPNEVAGWDFILVPKEGAPVPLLATSAWSDIPHFVRCDYYRHFVFPAMTSRGELEKNFPEEPLFHLYTREIKRRGFVEAQPLFGTCIYGNLGDPPVTRHLDGIGFGVPGYVPRVRSRPTVWP